MYTVLRSPKGEFQCIQREDGACIPIDPRNRDYIEFLAWQEKQPAKLDLSSKPTPPAPPTAEELKIENIKQTIKAGKPLSSDDLTAVFKTLMDRGIL